MRLAILLILPLLSGCNPQTKAATTGLQEAQDFPAGRFTMTYDAAKKGVYVLDTRYGHLQFCQLDDDLHLVSCKGQMGVTP
jgi:hypothetical protein